MMLNQIEAAMVEARGFDPNKIATERVTPRDVIARASKPAGNGFARVEALGRNEQDAVRKLLGVITRR